VLVVWGARAQSLRPAAFADARSLAVALVRSPVQAEVLELAALERVVLPAAPA
jgi:hypothetical protein